MKFLDFAGLFYLVKFIDKEIQRTKKEYIDSASSTRMNANMNKLKSELQEIQNIMVQNIDDVLSRGDALQCNFSFKFI